MSGTVEAAQPEFTCPQCRRQWWTQAHCDACGDEPSRVGETQPLVGETRAGAQPIAWQALQAAYQARRAAWDAIQRQVEAQRIALHGACKP